MLLLNLLGALMSPVPVRKMKQCQTGAIAVPTPDITGAKRLCHRFETRNRPGKAPSLAVFGPKPKASGGPATSLHSTSPRDSSLARTRPVARRQRALCVFASKQRGLATSPPRREAKPRDGVAYENAVSGAEIV